MSEIRLPRGAGELLNYFEDVNREDPDEHWQNGADMCRRWLALADATAVSQAEIDDFVAQLKAEPKPGTDWIDLGMQFKHWARSRGFTA
jgi:hypothetical protein